MRRIYHLILSGLILTALLAAPAGARAQFRYGVNPAAGYGYAQTQAVANAASDRARFSYTPYGGGYGNTYNVQTPVNGYLTGAADVMSANGQYEISHQQANLTREQVKSAHIDNRRKMFDEQRYEKENTPTLWQRQEEDRREQLMQARYNPQDTEIWSGRDLNLLLDDIRIMEKTMGLRGAEIPLDPDVVKHISLGTGNQTGSSTMLNNGGKLKWPPELDDEKFDGERKKIDQLFLQATQQAIGPDGQVSGRTMRDLAKSLDQMQDLIDGAINDMSPSDNIRAKRFVNEVTASSKMLKDPNVAKTLSGGEWAPKGATVGELIANMNRNGQKFGPAGPADRPYYSSLYLSLLEYDSSLMAMASRAGPSPGMRQ